MNARLNSGGLRVGAPVKLWEGLRPQGPRTPERGPAGGTRGAVTTAPGPQLHQETPRRLGSKAGFPGHPRPRGPQQARGTVQRGWLPRKMPTAPGVSGGRCRDDPTVLLSRDARANSLSPRVMNCPGKRPRGRETELHGAQGRSAHSREVNGKRSCWVGSSGGREGRQAVVFTCVRARARVQGEGGAEVGEGVPTSGVGVWSPAAAASMSGAAVQGVQGGPLSAQLQPQVQEDPA